MKLLRVGNFGEEIPAIIDKENKIRDLSKVVNDFNPESLNFEILDKIKKVDLNSLEIIKSSVSKLSNKSR